MELISQHVKAIMEGCKERARAAGLRFEDETLEYIVTNRDLIELSPKVMIPTLYDYWVHDVEVLKEKGRYELYPGNPYETVINTRPAISFYNDNNPDWLNVMIFYHVLGHIDFFQNNLYFRHTWDYDFTAQALSDKRLIARLRAEKGRWVDYVIEFARAIDNLVGFFPELDARHRDPARRESERLDFYFDVFLQQGGDAVPVSTYVAEIERYNETVRRYGADKAEGIFFDEVRRTYPEFAARFERHREQAGERRLDLLQFLTAHSPFLAREENRWMTQVMEVIRGTALFFQPQIRTKIMNEGWASYWHEKLFLDDERISGHEVEFARVNAQVVSMPKVGLNPYALGMRLFQYIEEAMDKGRYSFDFARLARADERRAYDAATGKGRDFIFQVRENYADVGFVHSFIDQDFVDANKLFVAGKRLDEQRMVWQYYVKSRKAADYKAMVAESLYHPPRILIREDKGCLYLEHVFEGKPLVRDYIANTMMGIEFLWGGVVRLETSEVKPRPASTAGAEGGIEWERVVYTMEKRKLSRRVLS